VTFGDRVVTKRLTQCHRVGAVSVNELRRLHEWRHSQNVMLDTAGLARPVEVLIERGYRVVGPTLRDNAIVLAELSSADELPRGLGGGHGPRPLPRAAAQRRRGVRPSGRTAILERVPSSACGAATLPRSAPSTGCWAPRSIRTTPTPVFPIALG
jgi:hypothetical protein